MCFVLVTNFLIGRVLAPLQHSTIFEIILNLESLQLQICYVFFNKIMHCSFWFLCCCFHFSHCVFIYTFFALCLCIYAFFASCLCMFGSSNAFATTFNDFDLSTFGNLDFARWVFNFLLWFCCKFFALSCLFSLLFYQNNLQFVRLKFPCT